MANSTSSIVSPATVRFVSSANSRGLTCLRQSGRSFMYKRNKSGPRMEPCGIPHVTLLSEVITSPSMVGDLFQNSTKIFIQLQQIYSYSTKIFIQLQQIYSYSTKIFIQLQQIYSYSTKIFIQLQQIYSYSTKIFIQLQQKYSFNFNEVVV